MKDLEKIKSEDLGCQVADANPGNFAIEQEVAQLVGATVPAPTEPSADDARELGAQLLVFLRRALTPIKSALRTAVAAIYAHLDSRCTDYTHAAYAPYRILPYDPMRPFVPRTLPNLLTALTAFSARKISGADVADGMSLIHLMTDTSEVTELTDDNRDWNLTSVQFGLFPNATKIQAWFKDAVLDWGYSLSSYILNSAACTEFDMRYFEEAKITGGNVAANYLFRDMAALTQFNLNSLRKVTCGVFYNCDALTEVELPSLKEVATGVVIGCDNVERVVADELERVNGYANAPALIANNPKLRYASFPKLNYWYIYGAGTGGGSLMNMPLLEELIIGKAPFTSSSQFYRHVLEGCESLVKLDLRGDLNQNIYLDGWNPTDKGTTFLQNFREHIALRLTANGSGLTLTLSQAVRNAIHAAESTYGIENIIVTQKGWTISPAPN